MNKKAMLFNVFVWIFAVLILATTFMALMAKYENDERGLNVPAGTSAFKLYGIYATGEGHLIYTDSAGRLSAYQSVYDLGVDGGHYNLSECGEFAGVNLWNTMEEDECFPEYEENLGELYNDNMDYYTDIFPDAFVQPDNYDFLFDSTDGLMIYGFASSNIQVKTGTQKIPGLDLRWPTIVRNDMRGIDYYLSSCFGRRKPPKEGASEFHRGLDMPNPTGTPIYAALGGEVEKVSSDKTSGNYIKLKHSDNLETLYAHMSQIDKVEDDVVAAGETIGEMGSTGVSSGPHLHFGLKKSGQYIDPLPFFYNIEPYQNPTSLSCNRGGNIKYAVKPSFKTKIDYQIDYYAAIPSMLAKINVSCKELEPDCIQDLVKDSDNNMEKTKTDAGQKSTGYDWIIKRGQEILTGAEEEKWNKFCEPGYERVMNDFVGFYQGCSQQKQDKCYCAFNMNENGNLYDEKYEIQIDREDDGVLLNWTKAGWWSSKEKAKQFYIPIKGELPRKFYSDKDEVDLYFGPGENPEIKNAEILYLYKEGDIVQFVKKDGDTIKRLDDSVVGDKQECEKSQMLRICIIDNNHEFAVYDRVEEKPAKLPVVIRFSYAHPGDINPPPPIQEFSAYDKPKAENSIVLEWKKSAAEDTTYYNIYCEKSPSSVIMTKNIGTLEPSFHVYPKTDDELIKISLNTCNGEEIADNLRYTFAVTAVDANGNEEQDVEKIADAVSKDDLAPGIATINLRAGMTQLTNNHICIIMPADGFGLSWEISSKNIDGSQIRETDRDIRSNIHYANSEITTTDFGVCELGDNTGCYSTDLIETFYNNNRVISFYPGVEFDKNSDFVAGVRYCFAVVSHDEVPNYLEMLDYTWKEPAEWVEYYIHEVIEFVPPDG